MIVVPWLWATDQFFFKMGEHGERLLYRRKENEFFASFHLRDVYS